MASKLIISLLGLGILCFSQSTEGIEIGGDLGSTALIVGKLCLPFQHNDDVAAAFLACYDTAPGKEQFLKCQTEAFGRTLGTNANITYACLHAYKMGGYVSCLKREFTAAGLDQEAAVTIVNKCQAKAVNLCE